MTISNNHISDNHAGIGHNAASVESLSYLTIVLVSGGKDDNDRQQMISQVALRGENIGMFITVRPLHHYGHNEDGSELPDLTDTERAISRTPGFMLMINSQFAPFHSLSDMAADNPRFSFDCALQRPDGKMIIRHFGYEFAGAARFARSESSAETTA